jgi:hypothetical protein
MFVQTQVAECLSELGKLARDLGLVAPADIDLEVVQTIQGSSKRDNSIPLNIPGGVIKCGL